MKKMKVLLTVVLITGFIVSMALAAEDRPNQEARQRRTDTQSRMRMFGQGDVVNLIMRATRSLELTEQQQTEIQAILEQNQEQTNKSQETLQAAEKALRDAIFKSDDAGISKAVADLTTATTANAKLQATVVKTIRAKLTDEQNTKLAEAYEQMGQRGRGFMGEGPAGQTGQRGQRGQGQGQGQGGQRGQRGQGF